MFAKVSSNNKGERGPISFQIISSDKFLISAVCVQASTLYLSSSITIACQVYDASIAND